MLDLVLWSFWECDDLITEFTCDLRLRMVVRLTKEPICPV